MRIIPACAENMIGDGHHVLLMSDHPRVRGEYSLPEGPPEQLLGSSPRVRGILDPRRGHEPGARIIPACAGNILPVPTTDPETADHPRVCGEYESCPLSIWNVGGSSPRVRGIFGYISDLQFGVGIIPACAGNITCPPPSAPCSGDHPRVCGEYLGKTANQMGGLGSSPRVRGIYPIESSANDNSRIIPACAGNMSGSCRSTRSRPDHPRVCGEYFC